MTFRLCIRYNEVLLLQARVTPHATPCIPSKQDFAGALQSIDRAESDAVELTQEFLGQMLAVRRRRQRRGDHIRRLGPITTHAGLSG